MSNKKTNEEEKIKWWYYLIFPGVSAVWALNFFLQNYTTESGTQGLFRDMFGAVNALSSGLVLHISFIFLTFGSHKFDI